MARPARDLGCDRMKLLALRHRLRADARAGLDPEPLPDAVVEADMLRHLIEARGLARARVATDAGIAETTISAILQGERAMGRKHVAAPARDFRVSPAVFLPA